MKFFKKHLLVITAFTGIFATFLFTRIYNILNLPIFTDEAIYVRWGQIARQDPEWRFISLTDGKQPSFVWLDIVSLNIFQDPLLAGRMVSVFAGLLAVIGLFFLAREIFKNTKVGLIAAFIYAIYPFALVYDRMALYDSLVAMFAVWTLYFEILLVRRMKISSAIALGVVIGGAVLTKSSGFFAIYLMPFLFFLLDFKKKDLKKRVLKLAGLLILSAVIAQVIYAFLRISPFFHIIAQKNTIFVHPVGEWILFPLNTKIEYFWNNVKPLSTWFFTYFSIPFLLLLLSSLIAGKKYWKEKILLLIWFATPFMALAVFGNTLYPRYIFFMTMPLIPLVAYGFYEVCVRLKKKVFIVLAAIIFLIIPLRADYFILTDLSKAPIPNSDKEQYITGWPAGGGVKESVAFFEKEAQKEPIVIATQGTFGLMPYAYESYLVDKPNISIKAYWPINDTPPQELLDLAQKQTVYTVFYQPCPSCPAIGKPPVSWPVELIMEYKKPGGKAFLGVYKFKTE